MQSTSFANARRRLLSDLFSKLLFPCLCFFKAAGQAARLAYSCAARARIRALASIAQLAEHALRKRMVVGSIPTGGSDFDVRVEANLYFTHRTRFQMSAVGFEPTRSCLQWILSPLP